MMSVQESLINFLLTLLQASTSHVSLAHSLYLLQSVLLAELVEALVNVI